MIYNPSRARPYKRRGKVQRGRWEIDLRGVLDNGLEVKRERRVFPPSAKHDGVGKRQAQAMAREEFERWNRHGAVLRPGEVPLLSATSGMKTGVAPTFKQFAPDFLTFSASPSASARGSNRPNTLRIKELCLRVHLLPAFGSLRMDALNRRLVDRYVAGKLESGLHINTIVGHLEVLHRMLKVAKTYELLDKIPEFRVPLRQRKEIQVLDHDEIERFISTAWELFEERRATLMELYVRTGLRSAEGVALVPADFSLDVERPVVRVERQWLASSNYGPPKGKNAGVVPLRRSLAARIDELLRLRELAPRNKDRHPFSAARSTVRPLHPYYAHHLVSRVGQAADLPHARPHLLRHTFGTECARRGVPPLTIKEWMGHVRTETTMRYVHLVAPDHLRWADLMEE